MCTFLFWMAHCGMWDGCIVGFVSTFRFWMVHCGTGALRDLLAWFLTRECEDSLRRAGDVPVEVVLGMTELFLSCDFQAGIQHWTAVDEVDEKWGVGHWFHAVHLIKKTAKIIILLVSRSMQLHPRAPFTNIGWTLIPARISDHIPSKVWDEITYPFPNFNGCSVEVWEWIIHFIPHFIMDVITYSCRDYS